MMQSHRPFSARTRDMTLNCESPLQMMSAAASRPPSVCNSRIGSSEAPSHSTLPLRSHPEATHRSGLQLLQECFVSQVHRRCGFERIPGCKIRHHLHDFSHTRSRCKWAQREAVSGSRRWSEHRTWRIDPPAVRSTSGTDLTLLQRLPAGWRKALHLKGNPHPLRRRCERRAF